MKKILSLILVLVMCLSLVACGSNADNDVNNDTNDNVVDNNTNENETPDVPDEPVADPIGALEVLNTVWANWPEEEKSRFMGGYYDAFTEGAPGQFDHTNVEFMAGLLIANAEASAMVDDVASLYHMMNYNNFTCGSFRVTDAANVEAFVASMKDSIMNNMWMCGFPEVLVITQIGENNVVVNFGITDMVTAMKDRLVEAYSDAVVLVEEPIL